MERREMATFPRVSAGDHPPLSPSYRMSRQMWPLLYMCGCTGEGGMKYTCAQQLTMLGKLIYVSPVGYRINHIRCSAA